jgi:hypothetical protein
MPRRPNYSYERFQRETAKTAKREAKRQARADRLAQPVDGAAETADNETADAPVPAPERTPAD